MRRKWGESGTSPAPAKSTRPARGLGFRVSGFGFRVIFLVCGAQGTARFANVSTFPCEQGEVLLSVDRLGRRWRGALHRCTVQQPHQAAEEPHHDIPGAGRYTFCNRYRSSKAIMSVARRSAAPTIATRRTMTPECYRRDLCSFGPMFNIYTTMGSQRYRGRSKYLIIVFSHGPLISYKHTMIFENSHQLTTRVFIVWGE